MRDCAGPAPRVSHLTTSASERATMTARLVRSPVRRCTSFLSSRSWGKSQTFFSSESHAHTTKRRVRTERGVPTPDHRCKMGKTVCFPKTRRKTAILTCPKLLVLVLVLAQPFSVGTRRTGPRLPPPRSAAASAAAGSRSRRARPARGRNSGESFPPGMAVRLLLESALTAAG